VLDADETGERPYPAESTTEPMGKLPHDGNVTVWPWRSVPMASDSWPLTFTFGLADADEEV